MRRNVLLAISMATALVGTAQAGVVLDVIDTSITPGTTGFVDVMVYSTTGSDTMGAYNLDFQITQLGGTAGDHLQFGTQTDYFYYGANSVAAAVPMGISSVSTLVNSNDYITLSDAALTSPGFGTSLPNGQANEVLLARLEIDATHILTGDSFKIGVDATNSNYFDASLNGPNLFSGLSHSGTVTAAVPEPSGFGLFSLGAGLIAWSRRRRAASSI